MDFWGKIGKDYINKWLDKQEYHSNQPELNDIKEAFVEGYKKAMLKSIEWLKNYRQETSDGAGYIAGIVNDQTLEEYLKHMEK